MITANEAIRREQQKPIQRMQVYEIQAKVELNVHDTSVSFAFSARKNIVFVCHLLTAWNIL